MPRQAVQIRVRRHLVKPSEPPKALHQALYNRVGAEIVLDVGHFDLLELRDVLEKARAEKESEGGEVTLFITDRFVLTTESAVKLLAVLQDMVDDLKANGMIPEAEREDSN